MKSGPVLRERDTDISLSALHDALRASDTGASTVVTPNRRLAVYHRQQFDLAQMRAGQKTWQTPDILPLSTFLERSLSALTLAAPDAPHLLSAAQSLSIWEDIVRRQEFALEERLMNVAQTAKQAADAFALANSWQLWTALRASPLSDDARLFMTWVHHFEARCREHHWLDASLLMPALTALLQSDEFQTRAAGVFPSRILAIGFDIVTPQQAEWARVCAEAGVPFTWHHVPPARPACHPTRLEFVDDAHEIAACAAWARQQLQENPARNIAIVAPRIEHLRAPLTRALIDALNPSARTSFDPHPIAAHCNFSLGQSLADYALVRDALTAITFSLQTPIPLGDVTALLRSSHIAGAIRERHARAALSSAVGTEAGIETALDALHQYCAKTRNAAQRCPQLIDMLQSLVALNTQRDNVASPEFWSRLFSRILGQWGFPGDVPLDSANHQVFAKCLETLTTLASLRTSSPLMRADDAFTRWRRIVTDTIFQPEATTNADAPIQILGVLESAGQSFDAMWVMGLSEDTWPLPLRPNPFIPAVLQRTAGVPAASPDVALALDRAITDGWCAHASSAIFSHAQRGAAADTEELRAPSALIRHVSLAEGTAQPFNVAPSIAMQLFQAGVTEPIPETLPSPLPPTTAVRGGATVLADQAACAFKAFARQRLGATSADQAESGLSPSERGTLIHRVLSLVWGTLGDSATLTKTNDGDLGDIVAHAATFAVQEFSASVVARLHERLRGRFAELEIARLTRAVTAWLLYERQRAPFKVVSRELAREVVIGPLKLKVRLDRLDQFEDHTYALIDYKTGVATLADLLGERPNAPQLPLYFVTAEEAITAVAFARLKRGEAGKVFGFEGASAIDGALPHVAPIESKPYWAKRGYESWDVLTAEWERTIASLATDFATGTANVNPKQGATTCARCDLQSVCRVHELLGHNRETVDNV